MATGLRLSVAIPIPNEESVLPELLLRLRFMLDANAGGAPKWQRGLWLTAKKLNHDGLTS
jgi:hypothetical protein